MSRFCIRPNDIFWSYPNQNKSLTPGVNKDYTEDTCNLKEIKHYVVQDKKQSGSLLTVTIKAFAFVQDNYVNNSFYMNIVIMCTAVDAPADSFNSILWKIEADCNAELKCAGITLEPFLPSVAIYFHKGFQFGQQKTKFCQKNLLPDLDKQFAFEKAEVKKTHPDGRNMIPSTQFIADLATELDTTAKTLSNMGMPMYKCVIIRSCLDCVARDHSFNAEESTCVGRNDLLQTEPFWQKTATECRPYTPEGYRLTCKHKKSCQVCVEGRGYGKYREFHGCHWNKETNECHSEPMFFSPSKKWSTKLKECPAPPKFRGVRVLEAKLRRHIAALDRALQQQAEI